MPTKVTGADTTALIHKFTKGTKGSAGVVNPETLKETTWEPVRKFLGDQGFKGPIDVFHDGKPSGAGVVQGDIGNCYFVSSDGGLADDDPNLQIERVREIGTAADGSHLFAVLFFVKPDSDAARLADAVPNKGEFKQIQRAAPDVTRTRSVPDPKDPKNAERITQTKRSTPVWVIVSDEVPVELDHKSLNASDPRVKNEGAVLYHPLTEKAEAVLHFGTYRSMNNGGDALTALEELTGYPASTINVNRATDPTDDTALAIAQFKNIIRVHQDGGTFIFGTWGNNKPNKRKGLEDNDSITRIINDYPQYNADGTPANKGEGFFKPDFQFRDGTGSADHGSGKESVEADRDGSNSVGDHDQTGTMAKILNGKTVDDATLGLGDLMVAFRNPWASTRPIAFTDGKMRDDGVNQGPWGILRTLVGTISFGGRPKAMHDEWLQGVIAPTLPEGIKSTFKPVGNETLAK